MPPFSILNNLGKMQQTVVGKFREAKREQILCGDSTIAHGLTQRKSRQTHQVTSHERFCSHDLLAACVVLL
jgi:hypothetical protein